MEENYCQRMKHFVLRDHICSHLVLSKLRSTMLLCSGACRTVVHLPESGSLELLSGNQHSRRQRGSRAWASTQCLIHLTPKAASASGAEHRQPETPWVCHFCRGLSHIFQKHTRAAALSWHCVADLAGNAPWKGTALKAEHCTTAFLCCGTDWVPIMYH